jgi:UDP-N-acetyl-2-amino-2-deoxyglucuronate dehydrogenase
VQRGSAEGTTGTACGSLVLAKHAARVYGAARVPAEVAPVAPLRVGILGGGGISDTHARAVRSCDGLEVVAFCGENAARTEGLAKQHEAVAYSRLDEFLAHRPMQAVVIGSPSGLHAQQGIAAVERGLHVLVEKPIDIRTDRAAALVEAAARAGVTLGVIFQDRTKPAFVRLREAIRQGALGQMLVASASVKWYRPPEYYAASRWRGTLALDGGAALINQGIHTVDLLRWLLGPVARVKAQVATRMHAIEGEDVALALLEFASGVVATLEVTTCAFPGYPRRLELTGTAGTVLVSGDEVVAADLRSPRPDLVSGNARPVAANAASPLVSDVSAHAAVIQDFAEAVRSGRAPLCDGRDGAASLAVVEAIYAAGRVGGVEVGKNNERTDERT